MCNEDFYEEFGNELFTFNGLDYSVNNHSPGARYMATGKLDSLAYPTFAALVAACRGPDCPHRRSSPSATIRQPAILWRCREFRTCNRSSGSPTPTRSTATNATPYHDKFAADRIEEALREATHGGKRHHRRTSLPRAERGENMLYAAQVNSKAPRARDAVHSGTESRRSGSRSKPEIALASFKAGVCVSANLTIGQFDSHANNDPDQMKLIPEFLAGIAYLMRRADELKDPRKARRDCAKRDGPHADLQQRATAKTTGRLVRSCSCGRGIKGNRVIGATDAEAIRRAVRRQNAEARQGEGNSGAAPNTFSKRFANTRASPTIAGEEVPVRCDGEGETDGIFGGDSVLLWGRPLACRSFGRPAATPLQRLPPR